MDTDQYMKHLNNLTYLVKTRDRNVNQLIIINRCALKDNKLELCGSKLMVYCLLRINNRLGLRSKR